MIAQAVSPDGARLSFCMAGPADAPCVLLLHSLGCDGGMWSPQIGALQDCFRLIVPDARGHGESAAPDGPYSLDQLGRDALAVQAAHVCGISMGGMVAQWLAAHAPRRVRQLVLANTALRIGAANSWREREAAVRDRGMQAIAEAVLDRFFGPAFASECPETVARFRERLLTTNALGYAGCCAALRDADLTLQAGSIAAQTLVIAGSQDVSTPAIQSQALADAIRHARLTVLRSAHLSNIAQPAAFTQALVEHFVMQESPHG